MVETKAVSVRLPLDLLNELNTGMATIRVKLYHDRLKSNI